MATDFKYGTDILIWEDVLKLLENKKEKLIAELPIGPIILYAIPGKEKYYQRFGFKKLLTGMALFPDQKKRISQGFIKNK